MTESNMGRICTALHICIQQKHTLNREPIDDNFDDLEDSSAKGGNRPETKEHLE